VLRYFCIILVVLSCVDNKRYNILFTGKPKNFINDKISIYPLNNITYIILGRGDHFRFGSVFIKKSNQTEIFFFLKKPKPNRNLVKPTGFGPGQTDRFRFGSVRFFREKTSSNRFGSVFWFWLGFFSLARFFRFGSVFFLFGFGSVRFGFFGFFLIKLKPNRTGRFFQNFNWFNRFFLWFGFFGCFFSGFLDLISFSVFLLIPNIRIILEI